MCESVAPRVDCVFLYQAMCSAVKDNMVSDFTTRLSRFVAAPHRLSDADAEQAALVSNGRGIPATGHDGPVSILDPAGQLIAVMRDQGRLARPEVVFN